MMLPPAVVFGLVLVAFAGLHVLGWKLAEKLGQPGKIIAASISLLLCLPGAWFAFYYLHLRWRSTEMRSFSSIP